MRGIFRNSTTAARFLVLTVGALSAFPSIAFAEGFPGLPARSSDPAPNAEQGAAVPPSDKPIFGGDRAAETPLQVPPRREPALSDEPLTLREETRTWYGTQNLGVMTSSIAIALILGSAGYGPAAFAAGVGGFYLGPPIVHWAHGNVGKGFASLGLGAGGALLAGTAGALTLCAGENACEGDMGALGAAIGFAIGALVAAVPYVIIDVGYLAWDELDEPAALPKPDPSSFRLAPNVWFAQNQTTFGFSGEF